MGLYRCWYQLTILFRKPLQRLRFASFTRPSLSRRIWRKQKKYSPEIRQRQVRHNGSGYQFRMRAHTHTRSGWGLFWKAHSWGHMDHKWRLFLSWFAQIKKRQSLLSSCNDVTFSQVLESSIDFVENFSIRSVITQKIASLHLQWCDPLIECT